ncbi:uncharacterized protein LOC116297176 [Actinia tenebrosa]|uniref:Uncharacterized protein LOC116297176 n=1 Tax=Actinia tenebrosa TaxID=6105 RepID=A0A6P8I0Z3_ACTTE|nr:uncharacterized protein LOC116297176 [Actinia tenebrosa]
MKISTKFNLFIGFFFFFVFMAVFYSYCGGLNVCFTFPFLNGIRSGSVSKGKVLMTSYIIDENGESRDDASNTIYFYTKVKGKPHLPKETTRKPGDENNTRKKNGSSSNNPPSDITGKVALDILRKSNTSLEEANRELFREEKVDKQVDREDLIKSKPIPTQFTPITKNRGDLGIKYMQPRIHLIRKPPRKLRKIRINRLSKQGRIDKALEKKLERADAVMRMRKPGNEPHFSKMSHLRKKDLGKISVNQREEKNNFTNEAVNPLDVLKYRNESIVYAQRHSNEAEWRGNTSLTPKSSRHFKHNFKKSRLHVHENKTSPDEKRSNKIEKKAFHSENNLLEKKGNRFDAMKSLDSKLFTNKTEVSSQGNNMTSSGMVKTKRNKKKKIKVEEGSGINSNRSISTRELRRSIRNINDQHIKLALQSALNKDEQQLKNDVMRIKTSLEGNYRPFNLTRVLRELVTEAETPGEFSEKFARAKQELLLKRRNSDADKPLVRVKRLGRINNQSEKTLIRVKRLEDEDPNDLDNKLSLDGRLDRAKKI